MKLPQFSVRSMIWLVLVVAVDFGWVLAIYKPQSVFDLGLHYLDLPILGLFNVLAIAGYPLLARGKGRPVRVGFVGGGLFCTAIYVIAFRAYPALGPDINIRFCLTIYEWVVPGIFQPGNPGYSPRLALFYVVIGVLGMIPLVALSTLFGLLNWLVAKGKIPWMIAVAVVASLTVCGAVTLRLVEYGRLETYYKEVCETLSTEAADVSKELEKLRAAGSPPSDEAEKPIRILEESMTKYETSLAKNRRQLEIYRRAVKRPWLGVEE